MRSASAPVRCPYSTLVAGPLFRPLRHGLDLCRIKAPVLGVDILEGSDPHYDFTGTGAIIIMHHFKNTIFLAFLCAPGGKSKTMGVRFINDVIGGTTARFTGRKEMLTVEPHIPDVVQWHVPRADLLHVLGKFTDVVVIVWNVTQNVSFHLVGEMPSSPLIPTVSPIF